MINQNVTSGVTRSGTEGKPLKVKLFLILSSLELNVYFKLIRTNLKPRYSHRTLFMIHAKYYTGLVAKGSVLRTRHATT